MRSINRSAALVFAAALALAVLAVAAIEDETAPDYDGRQYIAMAEDPGAHVPAPYVTRVLGPLIVWALPFDERVGFRVLTVASFAIAAALLYLLLLEWRGSSRVALGGVAVYLAATSAANVHDPFLIDALSQCFIIGALLALARRRWWVLVPLLILAVLTRDSLVVLVGPALLLYALRNRDARVPLAAAVASAVAMWLVLNYTSLVLGFDPPSYNNFSPTTFEQVLDHQRQVGSIPKLAYRAVLFTFGLLWLIPLLRARAIRDRPWALAAALCGLLAVVVAPFVSDWTRALTYAFPAVLAGLVLLARSDRLRLTGALALCVAIENYAVQYTAGGAVRYGLELTALAVEGALLLVLAGWAGSRLVDSPRRS